MPCRCRSGQVAFTTLGLVLALGLSGCGGGDTIGDAMGFDRKGPDEMTVVKRPPLIVPPDFNLRPPRPGEARSDATTASNAARETLVGPAAAPATDGTVEPSLTSSNGASSSNVADAATRAEATLTGQPVSTDANEVSAEQDLQDQQLYQKSPPLLPKEERVAEAKAKTEPSAGQSALLSRSDKVERDLDALDERQGKNRVDGALLRRLIAWKPPAEDAAKKVAEGAEGDETPKQAVQIVRREQTPISTSNSLE